MTPTVMARRVALSGAVLAIGCLLIAGCAGSSSPAASAGAAAPGRALENASATGGGALAKLAPATRGVQAQTTALAPASQSIIYTASLTIRSSDVAAAAKRATAIVTGVGGYVADEHSVSGQGHGPGASISLTLKIPVAGYQVALAQLSAPALGKEISMQQQATDVTQQVADVNSLVTSEQDAIAALQGLLKRAASVSGLLQVQQQISSDESALNSLLAQQRALDHETTYATVTMTLTSPHHPAKHKAPARHGFVPGLVSGWRAFRHAVVWTLDALGAALPFIGLLVVLAGLGYAGRRRLLRRRARPTAET